MLLYGMLLVLLNGLWLWSTFFFPRQKFLGRTLLVGGMFRAAAATVPFNTLYVDLFLLDSKAVPNRLTQPNSWKQLMFFMCMHRLKIKIPKNSAYVMTTWFPFFLISLKHGFEAAISTR